MLPPLTSYLSCGHLFYRTLHLDESRNALYVGGMDRLIKVNIWILNFNCQSWKSFNLFLLQVNQANLFHPLLLLSILQNLF